MLSGRSSLFNIPVAIPNRTSYALLDSYSYCPNLRTILSIIYNLGFETISTNEFGKNNNKRIKRERKKKL